MQSLVSEFIGQIFAGDFKHSPFGGPSTGEVLLGPEALR